MMIQEAKLILGLFHIDAMKKQFIFIVFLVGNPSIAVGGYEPYNGYRGYVDCSLGEGFNPSSGYGIGAHDFQMYGEITTTHGYRMKNWFLGAGIGYYHSFHDNENMYPVYTAGCYSFEESSFCPFIETRVGIVYDPLWINTIQTYAAFGAGMKVYNRLQVGIRFSLFSRPSRLFTANASIVLSFAFGK